ncbi:LytR/AlgR family response regulator transcription factor [Lederbergia citrea]|uniref:LytTR family transcriptional regulator DNA-binding domain-containing protein n=1 Tax=Lederbergia citrea TaxID=2833581 RepID=A0A942Z6U1_9BACI|nr:LytTR family transcriptional regulator DNA-binding domain-containing protein [Lederbergia citrea]MBS4224835.1 LytTR family transcriptional regulator DNA-binding domain-containing protein [Lederbergia citrea]
MLKAYIVDDEPLARDELKYLLIRSKEVEILGESDCIEDAMADITALEPDLVFLDIELAEDNGLSLAKQLAKLEPNPAIVFATAYDDYALQAFELNAVDYILKPFDESRIQKTLEKIKKMQKIGNEDPLSHPVMSNDRNGKIAILVDERIVLLTYEDILYLESSEGKCTIKTMEQEYIVSDALVVLEKKLNKAQFFRVHRSFIVNLDHIIEIEPWFNSTYNLIMKDGSKVSVSRTYVKELKQLLGF